MKVKSLIVLGICFFILNLSGCLPVEKESAELEEEISIDKNEKLENESGKIYKMEYHKYPEEDIILQILSNSAGIGEVEWEVTDESEKRTGFQYKENVIVLNYEDGAVTRIYCDFDHYYERLVENEDEWEIGEMNTEGKEIQQQSAKMLETFGIEDCFVNKWKKIGKEVYLMKFYQKIDGYTVCDLLVEATDTELIGIPTSIEIAWGEEGLKYCTINFYRDIKKVQESEISYNYSDAENKVQLYWEQHHEDDEEWEYDYKVKEGTLIYVSYPEKAELKGNDYSVEIEYRPMWVFEVVIYSTGVGENKEKGTSENISSNCVDAQTGEVFQGW